MWFIVLKKIIPESKVHLTYKEKRYYFYQEKKHVLIHCKNDENRKKSNKNRERGVRGWKQLTREKEEK